MWNRLGPILKNHELVLIVSKQKLLIVIINGYEQNHKKELRVLNVAESKEGLETRDRNA